MVQRQLRIQQVGAFRNGNVFLGRVQVKQRAQRQEEDVYDQENRAECEHILLRVFQAAARQVFLHQILIQAKHGDGSEQARQKLPVKKLVVLGIVEKEDP